jgi:hypothetical protein
MGRRDVVSDASSRPGSVAEEVRVTLTVARLGEGDLFGWWGCHGLSQTGRYVLERTFPATWRSVALELDLISATRRHEEALGERDTALHLFSSRLPFCRVASAWLAEQKTCDPDPLFAVLAAESRDCALEDLARRVGPAPASEALSDGLRIGEVTIAELNEANSAWRVGRTLAASYAAIEGRFRAPYFDLVR